MQQGDSSKGDGVRGPNAIQEVCHHRCYCECCNQADRDSGTHNTAALPENQDKDLATSCAECDANTNLCCSLHHGIGDDAVYADGGQYERQRSKSAELEHDKPVSGHRIVDQGGE